MSAPLTVQEKEILLALARQTLVEAVTTGTLGYWSPTGLPERLLQPGATFVTLYHRGKLRGCVGVVEAQRPLAEDVREHTYAAAFHDPRFSHVQVEELDRMTIEISLLTPLREVVYKDTYDLLRQIRPGVDGVLIRQGERRATFLPKVWEKIADPPLFMSLLCEKMGAPKDAWQKDRLQVYLYQSSDIGG